MAQTVKNLPTMQETWVWSLGQEDPLEKDMGEEYPLQYSCQDNSMDGEPGGRQSMGLQKSGTRLSD